MMRPVGEVKVSLPGIELAHERASSLKDLWCTALSQTVEPACQGGGCNPMHQNSLDQLHRGNGCLRGRVRFTRKIFFGGCGTLRAH